MKRFYISAEEFKQKTITGDEFNHIKNVMRMNKGDGFIAFIGDEKDYYCVITQINKHSLDFEIVKTEINHKNPKLQIDIFQALAKGEKMELIAQKLTEIGVSTIFPLFVKNCDVKPTTNKPERIKKILISACKQCGRSIVPTIVNVITIKEALPLLNGYDLVLFANETEENNRIYDILNKNKNISKIALIIGPEGGFTKDEILAFSSVAKSVTLGSRILRTETAAIYIASIINDFYRN